ncbi:unnamed protein product [Pleuronectes platessa]|uniref:Uncharacterized protein n=1 Tax=Pleuronectes platessa TaxID=8262 RepID=A0A9N7UTC5_PLEPL|nr:unnamed protein product [Pleuronectes platessa]
MCPLSLLRSGFKESAHQVFMVSHGAGPRGLTLLPPSASINQLTGRAGSTGSLKGLFGDAAHRGVKVGTLHESRRFLRSSSREMIPSSVRRWERMKGEKRERRRQGPDGRRSEEVEEGPS